MCVAEALLRIPDAATRDALIRDKIGGGDWAAHGGSGASLFVNAATWGLMITGKLVATSSETTLGSALTRLVAKGGEPLIRKAVDLGMRLLGEQFVSGETIEQALATGRKQEAKGFTHSFDMLGEAATTEADARRYYADYERAIHAIGRASAGRGIYEGPGISLKLSALHPRFVRAQRRRVHAELLPRLRALALLARGHAIAFNIDSEEASRLDISLDLLEALALDPELADWNGLGFVVQTYQKRAPAVIDWMIDLARRSRRRLMLRMVKGAYWDAEIKRAQVDGLADYPVFTRKVHSDLCYLACAKQVLAVPDAVYPQFATHNALTLASVYHLAGGSFYAGQYEFQCLHGMGEPLYEEVVGPVAAGRLDRPCRIYAPVGTHETLLAYLVRRLLENGSNSSFVNQIADPAVGIDELVADPVAIAERVEPPGAPHARIPLPRALFGTERINSAGLDLTDEHALAALARTLRDTAAHPWRAAPMLADARSRRSRLAGRAQSGGPARPGGRGDRGHRRGRRRRLAPRERRRAGVANDAGDRARRVPRPRCRRARGADAGVARAPRARGGQVVSERDRRSARGRRFPALLRGGDPARLPQRHARAPRAGGVHQPVEFSAGDLPRAGGRGARRRQPGRRQAGRADAADRRGGGAHPARRRRAHRCACNCCPAPAKRSARRWSPTPARRACCSPARPPWRRRSRARWRSGSTPAAGRLR